MPDTTRHPSAGAMSESAHLSIGEVLALLLEEFPDVTISKIRFLESQGLIDPERTPSGYRKFFEPDVELLRVILREQREHYLPLRVIKDKIDSGELDPSGDPEGLPEVEIEPEAGDPPAEDPPDDADAIAASVRAAGEAESPPVDAPTSPAVDRSPQLLPGVTLSHDELAGMIGATTKEIDQLEEYGIITGRESLGERVYDEDAVEIAKIAVEFLRLGVDARHLRGWKTAADRETSVYDQLILPLIRQRNPEGRQAARDQLRRMNELGGKLRSALINAALRNHLGGPGG